MKMMYIMLILLSLQGLSSEATVGAGETCDGMYIICNTGQICQPVTPSQKTCRNKIGASCTLTAHCAEWAMCQDGTCVCPSNKTPQNNNEWCGIFIGGECDSSNPCVVNTDCTPDDECVCKTGYTPSVDNRKCLVKIEGGCNTTDDCIPKADCTSNTCACKAGFTANTDKDKCLGLYESPCASNDECISTLTCQDNKCGCEANKAINYEKTECRKLPGQTCGNSPECGANAECTGSPLICRCQQGHFNKDGERCGKKVDETCVNPAQCVPNADCKEEGGTKKCKCLANFDDKEKFCVVKSSALVMTGSLMLILAALLIPRWM